MATATIRSRSAKPFAIHHDEIEGDDGVNGQALALDESRVAIEEEDEQEEDAYSDFSDTTDEIVDVAVAEDMAKFEETFKGMKGRFRLINRIGEGMSRVVFTKFLN